jgi:hypothetical protein
MTMCHIDASGFLKISRFTSWGKDDCHPPLVHYQNSIDPSAKAFFESTQSGRYMQVE